MITLTLPPDLEDIVRRKVADGSYRTVEEAVADAILALDERDPFDNADPQLLRTEIDKGLAQLDRGETSPLTVLDILAREKANRQG
jgi:Arc/MetJ-type ribon-helix-helix transcriptional regulator